MTRITVENLTKVFGDPDADGIVAVDDVSFEVADGELLVLLGPSGCGKTTTLRMVGGLETPTEGTITFDDVVVNDVKARNRDVAMVFQDFALYPHMDVRGNLSFGLKREENDLSPAEIDERVEETARMLEIERLLNSRPNELSGGQKQRVALGRAIIRHPRVFLFDEPLANLDAKLRKTMRLEIDELLTDIEVTSLYVTHNQEEAMTIADRIAIMNEGNLQQVGTPAETFNQPANVFVADFIGSPTINLFDANVARSGDDYTLTSEDMSIEMPADLVPDPIEAESVTVGFRPQDLYQVGRDDPDFATVETEVRVIEPLGTEAVVHTATADREVTAKIDEFQHLERGATITLGIDPRHVYLFDASSGDLVKPRMLLEETAPAAE
jgi:multiple sugar transport system ATP-binding protein